MLFSKYLRGVWLTCALILLCTCRRSVLCSFFDIPIVENFRYFENNSDIFDESTGFSYDPLSPLVKCSYLPRHSIWCEPPLGFCWFNVYLESSVMSLAEYHILDEDTQFMEKYPNGLSLEDLLPFYDSVAKNEPLKLEWVCPGKIDPNAQRETTNVHTEANDTSLPKVSESLSSIVKLKEFDFDESTNQPLIPAVPLGSAAPIRRLAGSTRNPPRQPRVASMDKILNDFFKTRKEPSSPVVTTEVSTTSVTAKSNSQSMEFSQATRISSETNKENPEEDKQEALAVKLAKTSVSPQVACSSSDNLSSDFVASHNNSSILHFSTDQGNPVFCNSDENAPDETKMECSKKEETEKLVDNTNSSDPPNVSDNQMPQTNIHTVL
ncbi:unnamed protein product [Trichobilharzia szidati]|nr:unnamed protein product [Trichobilharzia szidati]